MTLRERSRRPSMYCYEADDGNNVKYAQTGGIGYGLDKRRFPLPVA